MKISIWTNTNKKSPRYNHRLVRVVEDNNTTDDYITGFKTGTPSGGIKCLAEDAVESPVSFDLIQINVVDRDDAQIVAEQLRKSFGLQCYNKRKISVQKSKTIAGE